MSENVKTLVCQNALFQIFTQTAFPDICDKCYFLFCYEDHNLPILPTNYHLFFCLVEWRNCPDNSRLWWTDGSGGVASVERGQYWSCRSKGNDSQLLAAKIWCQWRKLDDFRGKIIFINIEIIRSAKMKWESNRRQLSKWRMDGRTVNIFRYFSDASVRLLGVVLRYCRHAIRFLIQFLAGFSPKLRFNSTILFYLPRKYYEKNCKLYCQ